MKTSFENARNVRKIIVFSVYKCYKKLLFQTFFEFSKWVFNRFEFWKIPIESTMIGLHHTWRWFENSKPFSNYNIHFDLRIAQFTSTLRIRDTFVLDINNLLKIFGKFWFLTKCRNSNLLLYTWYNSVDTIFFGIGNESNMDLKLTSYITSRVTRNDRTLRQIWKCRIHCRIYSMPWVSISIGIF